MLRPARSFLVAAVVSCSLAAVGCSSGSGGGSEEADDEPWLYRPSDAGESRLDAGRSDASETGLADIAPPDDAASDADAGTDTAEAGVDTGPDAACEDSDADGLDDCEERRRCTDPYEADTDGDGLGDGEEFELGTDPCSADSDDDGLPDDREVDYELDPTDASSYDDGIQDGERWFVDTCESPETEPIDYHSEYGGNWTVGLPPTLDYASLRFTGVEPPEDAAVFGESTDPVAGAIVSKEAASDHDSPLDELQGPIGQRVRRVASVDSEEIGDEFRSHDGKPSAISEYALTVETPRTPRELRDELLFAIAPFEASQIVGDLPAHDGEPFEGFRLRIAAKFRRHESGETTHLVEFALVPRPTLRDRGDLRFLVESLATPNNLADALAPRRSKCKLFVATPDEGSSLALASRPIGASVRVLVDGGWSPRSRQNGWDLPDPADRLALFGSDRIEGRARAAGHPVWAAAHFETFGERCTHESGEANTCEPGR